MSIYAEIITIGDEILYGQTLDTNAHWISQQLDLAGFKVIQRTTIGDDEEEILKTFAEAEARASLILITGGLGPTNDDKTKPCLAKYFNTQLSIHPEALQHITDMFSARGWELTELNRQQAALPEACEMVPNPRGTAPGMWFERNGKVFVSMPGVPIEMKGMVRESVIPKAKGFFNPPVIAHKMIRTAGIGESWLADTIKDWEDHLPPHIRLAYLPSFGEVKLRLSAEGHDKSSLLADIDDQVTLLKPYIEKYLYSENDRKLEETIGDRLKEAKETLAIAESCTGGFVSHLITLVPGSSAYFRGSIVAYQNDIKQSLLKVSEETLARHGAVSEETVLQMAAGVRNLLGADIGISTSGIAGPEGGTSEKPVGTVWIAIDDGEYREARKLQLTKDRELNIKRGAAGILMLLERRLRQKNASQVQKY
ncbi:MAG TPA: competence/damage-inducible protein A [Cytophagales bacterium]|jgi:nicotinamide-nucleotide amidase|nr:competence/damage-inducible protein A [Cytophagales bacterium]